MAIAVILLSLAISSRKRQAGDKNFLHMHSINEDDHLPLIVPVGAELHLMHNFKII